MLGQSFRYYWCQKSNHHGLADRFCPKAMVWTPPPLNGIWVPHWNAIPPVNEKEESTLTLSRIEIDLAKNVFQIHGVDRHGKAVWKRRLQRDQWLQSVSDKAEPGCVIGMKACAGVLAIAWLSTPVPPD